MAVHAALFTVAIDNGDGSPLTGVAVREMEARLKELLLTEVRPGNNHTLKAQATPAGVVYTLNNRRFNEPLGIYYSFTALLKERNLHTWGDVGRLSRTELAKLPLSLEQLIMLDNILVGMGLWEETL